MFSSGIPRTRQESSIEECAVHTKGADGLGAWHSYRRLKRTMEQSPDREGSADPNAEFINQHRRRIWTLQIRVRFFVVGNDVEYFLT